MFCGSNAIFFSPCWSSMAAVAVLGVVLGLGLALGVWRSNMGITGMSELEGKLEVRRSISNFKVEACTTISSGPDLDHLLEAAEEESLLGVVECSGRIHRCKVTTN